MDRVIEPGETPVAPALAGEEHFRLITGFADLFTAIVLATGFFAIAGLAGATLGPLAGFVIAAAAWWLGRPIVEERKFAAGGIVLALAFTIGIQATLAGMLGIIGAFIGAGASWLYWRRYKVPIAAAAAILTPILIIGGYSSGISSSLWWYGWFGRASAMAVLWGLIVFAIAMYWDLSDRLRQTRRSDVAFWLHLAAAPLIVHGAFAATGLGWRYFTQDPHLQPVLILFSLLAVVALIVDRRPILVSSLSYLVYAMSSVIDKNAVMAGITAVALLLGGGILVLAVGWNYIRSWLLRPLPDAWAARLPPPATSISQPIPDPEQPASEHEPLRLIFGFNDIFVSIGIGTVIVASVFFVVWQYVMPAFEARIPYAQAPMPDWRIVLVPGVAVWLLAEYFARIRRMALPSIQLAIAFSVVAWVAGLIFAALLLRPAILAAGFDGIAGAQRHATALKGPLFRASLGASLVATGANLLFYWRHKVPIAFALAMSALVFPAFVSAWTAHDLGGMNLPRTYNWQAPAVLGGLALFIVALLFDRSDRRRQTLRADTAFWLHFAASLFVLPAVFSFVQTLPAAAWIAAALFAALVLVAIVLDRRAPVLVAMPFVISAFATSGRTTAAITLVICVLLVATTLFWDRIRAAMQRQALIVGSGAVLAVLLAGISQVPAAESLERRPSIRIANTSEPLKINPDAEESFEHRPRIQIAKTSEPLKLTTDAELHAVGIYEGDEGEAPDVHGPVAKVLVNRPGKKVALILTSYDPVRWIITVAKGTTITEIYYSSYGGQPPSEVVVNGRQIGGAKPAKFDYAYEKKGLKFRQLLEKVQASTGRRGIDSFSGAYRPDPRGFVIASVSRDAELKNDRLIVTPAGELPRTTIRADLKGPGVYDLSGNLIAPLPSALVRSAYVPSRKEYYAISGKALKRYDASGKELSTIAFSLDVPTLSWPTDITFNSRLNQIVVSSLGGEGFLYSYDLTRKKWSAVSLRNQDYNSFQYDEVTGHYMATENYGRGIISEIGTDGEVIRKLDLNLLNVAGFADAFDLGNSQISFAAIPRRDYIAIVVSKRIYVYDRRTKSIRLTYAD